MQISTVQSYDPAPRYPLPEISAGSGFAGEDEPLISQPVAPSEEGADSRPDPQPPTPDRRGPVVEDESRRSDQRMIEELKARDREVRAHEAAHLAAGGPVALGGINYTYQRGPNGVMYAIGGEVSIDSSAESTPEATLQKALIIRRAALAPAEPSTQDRTIAAKATRMAAEARAEIARQRNGGEEQEASPAAASGLGVSTYHEENHYVVAMPVVDEMA